MTKRDNILLTYFQNTWKYLLVILIYVLSIIGVTPFLIQLVLLPIFKNNPDYIRNLNNEEAIVELVINNQDSIGLMTIDGYNSYGADLNKFVIPVYRFHQNNTYYVFIVNNYSSHVYMTEDSFFEVDPELKPIFKEDILPRILDGEITNWNNGNPITFYTMDPEFKPLAVLLTSIDNDKIMYVPYYSRNKDGSYILDDSGNKIVADNYIQMSNFGSLFNFIYYVLMLIPMLFLIMADLKADLDDLKKNYNMKKYLLRIGLGFLIVLLSVLLSNEIVKLIQNIFNYNPPNATNQISLDRNSIGSNKLLMILTIALIGPFVEEIVFRKAFFKVIPNSIAAVITSSLIFGLIHVTYELSTGNILLILTVAARYVFAGFAFAYIYKRYNNNIFVTLGAHVINNGLSVLPILLLVFLK